MTMLAFHALAVAALQVAPAPTVAVIVSVPNVRVAPVIVATPVVPAVFSLPVINVTPSLVALPVINVAYQAAPLLDREPREPWAAQDPADSLYRQARWVLNRGEYRQAADLFQRITQRYPRSAYAGDAEISSPMKAIGFLPIGLFYHVAYVIGLSILFWFLVTYLWPSHLDE